MISLFSDDNILGKKSVFFTVIVLAIALGVKIFFCAELMLHDDEAYYWYWSRYPMWVYPDHGPLLGFFSYISVFILGDYGASMRIMLVLMYCLLFFLMYFWAVCAYGKKDIFFAKRLGFFLGVIVALIPHYFGLFFVRTDSLMIFFVFLAIGFSHLSIFHLNRRLFLMLAASIFWGLAFLAKLTTIFIFFGHVLFFFIVPLGRRQLFYFMTWIHFAIPFFFLVPMFYYDSLFDFPFLHNFFLRLETFFTWNTFSQFYFLQWFFYFPTYYFLFIYLLFSHSWMWICIAIKNFSYSYFLPPLLLKRFFPRWEEKIYFFLLSLPAVLYLFQKSFSMTMHANWTIFAAPGVTILLAFYFAERWTFRRWVPVIFHSSNFFLAVIYLALPFLLFSNIPTVATDGSCLYSKYSFLTNGDFSRVANTLDPEPLFVGSDYKLPSMINLYVRPKRDAIALMHQNPQNKNEGDFSKESFSLWNMVLNPNEIKGKTFYVLGEVSLKNEQRALKNFELSLQKTYSSFDKLENFTSFCRGKKIASFYLYKTTGYKFPHTLLSS